MPLFPIQFVFLEFKIYFVNQISSILHCYLALFTEEIKFIPIFQQRSSVALYQICFHTMSFHLWQHSFICFLTEGIKYEIHSEGCGDPGRTNHCGKSTIKVDGVDHCKHARGINFVAIKGKTGTFRITEITRLSNTLWMCSLVSVKLSSEPLLKTGTLMKK